MDPDLQLLIVWQQRVVLANSRKKNMLRVGLHFLGPKATLATKQVYLHKDILQKIAKYKASLDEARFQSFYGHSLEDAFRVWHHRIELATSMLVDEYLFTLHYFATGHVFALPGLDCRPKSNARYELARNASIISGWRGLRLLGVEVSPAIASPDKKSLYYYKQKQGEGEEGVENMNEHMLADVTLAQQTSRRMAVSRHSTVCASTIYVLYHPHGMGPGVGFWKCGPIEVTRGIGFNRAVRRFMTELQNSQDVRLPADLRNLDQAQVTVIVAVTDIQIHANPPVHGRRRRRGT